tara:strand:- start:34 stop:1311 length:1278 start_codon:yes stop_codon:yes gene_type:complete
MTIDKSTRQHYRNIGFSKVKPSKNGLRPGYAFAGTGGNTGSSGGTGGGGAAQRAREQAAAQASARHSAARRSMPAPRPVTTAVAPPSILSRPAPTTYADPVTTAVAPPSILSKPAPTITYKDPDPVTEIVPGDETFKPVEKYIAPIVHPEFNTKETLAAQKTLDIQQMIAKQQEEKYGVGADPTKFGEIAKPDLRTEKETGEDWERAQDWDLIKDMSKKGYDFNEIQGAMEKGLTAKTGPRLKSNLIESGLRSLRNVVPETGLEKSLLSRAKSFMPGAKEGIMGGLKGGMEGFSKYFNPKKMIANFALNKMGLGFINPLLGLASLMGFKNPFSNMKSRYALPYKKGPTIESRDGPSKPQDIVTAGIKKFQPSDQQTAQMDEIRRKMMILQGYADKGSLNERGQNTLAQMNQMITQYQADPRSIYG